MSVFSVRFFLILIKGYRMSRQQSSKKLKIEGKINLTYEDISWIASTFKFEIDQPPEETLAVLSQSASEGAFKGASVLWVKFFHLAVECEKIRSEGKRLSEVMDRNPDEFFENLNRWLKNNYHNTHFVSNFFKLLQRQLSPEEPHSDQEEKNSSELKASWEEAERYTTFGLIDYITQNYLDYSWDNLSEIILTLMEGIIKLPLCEGIKFLESYFESTSDSVALFLFRCKFQKPDFESRQLTNLLALIEYISPLSDSDFIAFLKNQAADEANVPLSDNWVFLCLYTECLNKIALWLLQCSPIDLENFLASTYDEDKTFYKEILAAATCHFDINDFEQLLCYAEEPEAEFNDHSEEHESYKFYIEKILPILKMVYPLRVDEEPPEPEAVFEIVEKIKSISTDELNQIIAMKRNFIDFIFLSLQQKMGTDDFEKLVTDLANAHETNPDILSFHVDQLINSSINARPTLKNEFLEAAFYHIKIIYAQNPSHSKIPALLNFLIRETLGTPVLNLDIIREEILKSWQKFTPKYREKRTYETFTKICIECNELEETLRPKLKGIFNHPTSPSTSPKGNTSSSLDFG
ncbi:CBU_1349 family Dot/Icm T4SS effector [Coxiella burnetii]|uniref:CBU_1349 family Dot/Icm T4SS effector n=1 Tax=Coxiella burnetii TaxID=777 RepID=UPI0021763E20|nr:CBU_1349 family Dot/Icm T4SS effector [Coxiella burnetii]